MDKRLKQKLGDIITQRRDTKIPAFMGNLRTGQVTVDGKISFVYVTIGFNGQVIEVKNNSVPSQLRLPIWLGYPVGSHRLQVVGEREGIYPNLDLPIVPDHNHTWGTSNNPSWIRKEQLLDLLPTAIGDMVVRVASGLYEINGDVRAFVETDFDMTSHIPASDANWCAVSIDVDGNITYTDGDTFDAREELSIEDLPTVTRLERVLFYAKMYEGQTQVVQTTTDTDLFDPRYLPGGVNGVVIDIDPAMTADSDEVVPSQAAVIDRIASDVVLIGDASYVRKFVNLDDPTVDDDDSEGYLVTDLWFNQATGTFYKCTDNTEGAAVWQVEGAGGGGDITWEIDGFLAVSDPCDVPHLITKETTAVSVYVMGENLGSAGDTEVDIDLNGGGSILSAPIVLAWDDANKWVKATPVVVDFVEGDILTPSIVGVATGASGLRIIVVPENVAGGGGDFNLTLEDESAGVSVSNVSKIVVSDDTLTDDTGGQVSIQIPAYVDPGYKALNYHFQETNAEDDNFNAGTIDGKWTQVGSPTIDLSTLPGWVGINQGWLVQAVPSGDWTIYTEVLQKSFTGTGGGAGGLLLSSSTNPASMTGLWLFHYRDALNTASFQMQKLVNDAYNAHYTNSPLARSTLQARICLAVNKNGTTYTGMWSDNGVQWYRIFQTSSLGFTPAYFGFRESGCFYNYFMRR